MLKNASKLNHKTDTTVNGILRSLLYNRPKFEIEIIRKTPGRLNCTSARLSPVSFLFWWHSWNLELIQNASGEKHDQEKLSILWLNFTSRNSPHKFIRFPLKHWKDLLHLISFTVHFPFLQQITLFFKRQTKNTDSSEPPLVRRQTSPSGNRLWIWFMILVKSPNTST